MITNDSIVIVNCWSTYLKSRMFETLKNSQNYGENKENVLNVQNDANLETSEANCFAICIT